MNEAEQDMKNYIDRGWCYRHRWITSSEIIPNSLIALIFIQNNSQFKNKLKHAYLCRCLVHLDSACVEDKELFRSANILRQQMLSLELSSCYVFRRLPSTVREFFFSQPKPKPRPQVFSVNGTLTCNCAALFFHFSRQTWSTVAGYGELCVCFQPIRNG